MAATYRANITAIFLRAFFVLLAGSAAAGPRQSAGDGRNSSSFPSIAITTLGTPITQNFNTLPASGSAVWANDSTLPGWYHARTGTGTTIVANDGTNSAGNLYSYGTGTNTDRALGSIGSGGATAGDFFWGILLTNNSGSGITSLDVSYTGEQWRNSAAAAQTISFSYLIGATLTGSLAEFQSAGVNVTSLNFTSPITGGVAGALNGNLAANRTAKAFKITGLSVANGQSIMLRWSDPDHASVDHGLAIDDLSITPNGTGFSQPIHTIQGSGSTSPLVGQSLTTTGIVTALRSNGFFLQTPDANADADPNTSEGIFVFTSSAPPPAAAIGNSVNVTGTVTEFIPSADPSSPPLTEISGSPSVSVLSTGNVLPVPITITAAETTQASETTNPLDTLEEYEEMRVHVDSLAVVAPTEGTITEASATSVSDGVFYGVVMGVSRPMTELGIPINSPVPTPPPANVPRFDTNPERLRIDSDAQPGSAALEVTTNATVTNLTGVLDYAFDTYTILPDAATPPVVTGNTSATAVPSPSPTQLTVAGSNLERFYDTTDDVGISDPVLTAAAFNNRLNKASLAIRNVMKTPDVIGVEEMENLSTLQTLANKINNDAVAAAQPNPNYTAFLMEGNDVGGIDVGFLVKAARVTVLDVTQFGLTTTYINPNNGQPELLNDRPPLVLRATVPDAANQSFGFTVIVNHLRSLNAIDDPADGNRVRTKRRAQAEYLANLVQSRQVADPNERLLLLGDFNAFQFNDGYVDTVGTIKGTPTPSDQVVLSSPDLVNPNLTDLVDVVPSAQRYSYSFGGNAEVLDHIIVTSNLLSRIDQLALARFDSDFPESFRNDANRPERISDHDAPVVYVSLAVSPTPTQVVSRKTHGSTAFDINLPLTGAVGIECRAGGASNDHQIILTFSTNVSVNGNPQAQVTNGTGQVGSGGVANGGAVTVAGASVTIPLTNVTNAQTIGITLFGVNDGTNIGDVVIPMGVLLGDVNGSGGVNATDVSQTKLRSGQLVDTTNFRSDVIVTNSINGTDVSAVKARSGTALP